MKLAFVQQIFEKYGSVKFHENPSSGSRTFACGRTDEQTGGERQTGMTQLIEAFRIFAKASIPE